MHNYFYIMLACVIVLNINVNIVVSNKVDSVLNLINEEMIASTVSEKSKLDAYNYKDISYLAIDHQQLIDLVNKTINNNLPNISHKEYYYFYDSVSKFSCKIGEYNCNSVQIKFTFNYDSKTYKEVLRYEPVSI